MSGVTVTFAGADPQSALTWLVVSENGQVRSEGSGDLEALETAAEGDVVLVLSGTEITAHEVAITARSEGQAQAAAPFAVEDRLASDLDELHIVLLPERRRGVEHRQRTVLAVSRTVMDIWTEAASEAGLSFAGIVPDYLLVPTDDDAARLIEVDGRILLRHGLWGAAIDPGMPQEFLDAVLAQRDAEPVRSRASAEEMRAEMAREAIGAMPCLLSGPYGVRRQASAERAFPWRGLVAASLALVALLIGQNLLVASDLSGKAREMEAEAERRFRAFYPEISEVRNLRAQIRERAVGAEGGQPTFLVLSAALALAMENHPELEIDFVRFNAETGEMTSSVFFTDYDDFAGFRSRVEAAGVVFEEGGSQQAGRRRAGNFTVRLAP
jgi:general secretion pathway protein L